MGDFLRHYFLANKFLGERPQLFLKLFVPRQGSYVVKHKKMIKRTIRCGYRLVLNFNVSILNWHKKKKKELPQTIEHTWFGFLSNRNKIPPSQIPLFNFRTRRQVQLRQRPLLRRRPHSPHRYRSNPFRNGHSFRPAHRRGNDTWVTNIDVNLLVEETSREGLCE